MGRLEDQITRLEAEIDGLLHDPEQALRDHEAERQAEHERLTQLIHALETGGDLSAHDPEEVEEIRGVLEDIRPALESLVARGAIPGPPTPSGEDGDDE